MDDIYDGIDIECVHCKKVCTISKDNYRQRVRENRLDYTCMSCACKIKNVNMSDEQRKKLSEIRSINAIKIWEKKSPEQREADIVSLHQKTKNYRDNMSDEQREKRSKIRSEVATRTQSRKTDDDKKSHSNIMKAGYRKWYNNMTDEERMKRSEECRANATTQWKNTSVEKFQNNCHSQAVKFNSIDNHSGKLENVIELDFLNLLKINNIDHRHQYYSTMLHPEFNNIFKVNPVSGNRLLNPYHLWDFLIYRTSGNILIDVDGGAHDPTKTSTYNGRKLDNNEYVIFNDSQRPYQTDGLDAYIVICYKGKLKDTTTVVSLPTNSVITVKQLIAILTPITRKDVKEYFR